MKMSILVSLFIFINSSFCFSQDNTLAEKLQMVKQRTLLVELPLMNDRYMEKLKNKEEVEELAEYTKHYNDLIENYKKAFKGFWTYNKEIQFKTYEEMSSVINQNTSNYAILRFMENSDYRGAKPLKSDPKFSFYIYKKENSPSEISKRKYVGKYSTLNLYLSEEQTMLLSCRLPVTESEGGMVYVIKQFDFTFDLLAKHPERKGYDVFGHNYYESELNLAKLKTSTVYLKKEDLDKGIDFEKIDNMYRYGYKIVSNEEWENAILEKKQNIICAILLPLALNSYTYLHMFFLASDGKMITQFPYNSGFFEDDFKYLTKFAK